MVPQAQLPIIFYFDNNGTVAQSKYHINHKSGKHIKRKYHLIRQIVRRVDVVVTKIASAENLADSFIKFLTSNILYLK